MIKKITLRKTACYCESEQVLNPLNIVNMIYGENGCGKTTLAKLIKGKSNNEFLDCKIEWENDTPLRTFVYDKDFIEETLRETKIKGIFTLGKEASEASNLIEDKKLKKNTIQDELASLSKQIQEKENQKIFENNSFEDKCWEIKKQYEEEFSPAFKGLNRSKAQFKERCIESINSDNAYKYDDIRRQANVFFSENTLKIKPIPELNLGRLFSVETSEVFQTKIIGKSDIPIADIINKVGNSDWIKRGIDYIDGNKCPFCQQIIPSNLREQLEAYFDESYTRQISELETCLNLYSSTLSSIIFSLENLANYECEYFKYKDIKQVIGILKAKFEKNKEIINNKIKEPSRLIKIDSARIELTEAETVIKNANYSILEYNNKMDNISDEKNKLIDKIWGFIGSNLYRDYSEYETRFTPIKLALDEMRVKETRLNTELSKLNFEITELEKTVTSTTPSKESINTILRSYGFDNFSINDAAPGYYKIQRPDGSHAANTLSEGERNFIAFLYFYQLIQGSASREELESPRVIVFDDPVSSLDSKILFIVSTLIRSFFSKDKMSLLNIKQIFIMTHNVYFHKEVSLSQGLKYLGKSRITAKDVNYWIIRKELGKSFFTYYEKNPIKTTYQLLWQEVRNYETTSVSNITICNTLRRILEGYFTILGGIDLNTLSESFEGDEKNIVRSLTSWINDGSHFALGSIEINSANISVENYLTIFKKIFDVTGHLPHYEMMMDTCGS